MMTQPTPLSERLTDEELARLILNYPAGEFWQERAAFRELVERRGAESWAPVRKMIEQARDIVFLDIEPGQMDYQYVLLAVNTEDRARALLAAIHDLIVFARAINPESDPA